MKEQGGQYTRTNPDGVSPAPLGRWEKVHQDRDTCVPRYTTDSKLSHVRRVSRHVFFELNNNFKEWKKIKVYLFRSDFPVVFTYILEILMSGTKSARILPCKTQRTQHFDLYRRVWVEVRVLTSHS